MPLDATEPYDALLLVSFGGPERPADVVPFLENVTRGRGIPRERLEEVGKHYFEFGGRSPINDQCRALIDAISADLRGAGIELPVYWGNRNWNPFLVDTIKQMHADGVRRAAAFVTSAYSSYSGCRQYREDLYRAASGVEGHPRIDKLRHYFNHPGFITAMVDASKTALDQLPVADRASARFVFVTHSIPLSMADSAGPDGGAYVEQHRSVASLVMAGVDATTKGEHEWELVFCSRSGSPRTPWLEPDVNDHLAAVHEQGARAVVVVPIGFISDHMEVVYDLDTEASATAARLGLAFARASTAGVHPAFVATVRDLLMERASVERREPVHRAFEGSLPASWDLCQPHCCPNPRVALPSLSQLSAEREVTA